MTSNGNTWRALVLMIFFVPGFLYHNFHQGQENLKEHLFQRVITWDNFGYFLWLPALLIYHDPWLQGTWLDAAYARYEPSDTRYQIHEGEEGRKVSIYHPGMALLSLPAFASGHIAALLSGAPADGFSTPYRVAYVFWFYLLLFIALRWLLESLKELGDGSSSFIFLTLFIAASNLTATLGNHGVYIHTAGFFLMAGLLKLWLQVQTEGLKPQTVAWLSAWAGQALITRPPLVIWLLIFLPHLPSFLKLILLRPSLLFFAWAALLPLGCLLVYWKKATGSWTFNLHTEVFSFNWQRLGWFLFSSRNGWLFYSPVFLLLIPGLILWWFQDKAAAVLWALCLASCVVLHGSWECWHYGGGYGQRTMTDYYPLLGVPLALVWRPAKGFQSLWGKAFQGIFLLLAFLNLFQTVQFFTGALTPWHNTWAYYRCQFLRLFPRDTCRPFLYFSPPPSIKSFKEVNLSRYDTATVFNVQFPETGDPSFAQGHEFSNPGLNVPYLSLSGRDHLLLIVETQKSPSPACTEDSLLAVAYLKSRGRMLFYQARPLQPSPSNSGRWENGFVIPENFSPEDSVRLYFWNRKRCPVILHRVRVVKATPRMQPTYVVR